MNLIERIKKLEEDNKTKDLRDLTDKSKKKWKWPFKWKSKINQSTRLKDQKVLVFYLNWKGEWEEPTILPYIDNMVIYKNKVHEFDPRDLTIIRTRNKITKMLALRAIDRRPISQRLSQPTEQDLEVNAISNNDWAEVRNRGDATDSDEILIKAAASLVLKPEQPKKPVNWTILIIVGVILIGGIIFFLTKK